MDAAFHPPDRGHLSTEAQLEASRGLDALPTLELLRVINDEDALVAGVVRAAAPALAAVVDVVVEAFARGGRLVYFGAGTSGRLGVLDASECPPTFCADPRQVVGVIAGGDAALRRSSEGAEDEFDGPLPEIDRLNIGPDDVVIAIAAGGTTPYAWGAIHHGRSRGATTTLLCCVPAAEASSHKPQASLPPHHVVELPVGPEVVTGSTRMKAGTATKMALNMISTAAMVRAGKVWGNLMVDLSASNAKLVDRAVRIITTQTGVSRARAMRELESARGRVKVALVMIKRGVDAPAAQRLLDAHAGRLRPILGAPG